MSETNDRTSETSAMTETSHAGGRRRRSWGTAAALLALLLGAGTGQAQQSTSSSTAVEEDGARAVVGRVVSARGAVFAQSPGEERRIVECRDPIFDGDKVLTLEGSDVGIDAGSYYVRLGQESTAELRALDSGAPSVDLLDGHARLIDSDADSDTDSDTPGGAPASLSTPGLVLARTGADQDALVFAEKAGVVSMVCAYGQDLEVARRGLLPTDPASMLVALSGGCVVGKPREALFRAEASHPQLAVLMRDACEELASVPVAGFFSPSDVALGPAAVALGASAPPPGPAAFGTGPAQACSGGCSGGAAGGPGTPGPTIFVPIVPVIPAP
jgi:hypothetical protein